MSIHITQIDYVQSAYIGLSNLSVTGSSLNIATAISTALNTAGRGGSSIPVQVSTGETTEGLIVSTPNNRVEIRNYTTQDKIIANGEEVYGRLSNSGAVYTLSFYTNIQGTETAYTFASSTPIDLDIPYRFQLWRLPADAGIGIVARNINNDPSQAGSSEYHERLTIVTQNTVPNLTKTPSIASNVRLVINGVMYHVLDANPLFTVSGKVITWNAAQTGGFTLQTTGFNVIAMYPTNE
jgi:hypothetical protein